MSTALMHSVRVFVLLLLLAGCGKSDSVAPTPSDQKDKEERADPVVQEGPVVYEVQVQQEKICSLGRVLVNGFPVDEWGGQAVHQKYDFPVNTALVGQENVLTVENEPCFSGGRQSLSTGPIKMKVRVKGVGDRWLEEGQITEAEVDSAYREWKKKAKHQWKEYRGRVAVLDSMRAWASRHPMTVSTTFDNEAGPDFSQIFEEASRLPDRSATRERLRDYAMHLRDLMAEKDTSALFQEARPLFTDHDTGTPYEKDRVLRIIANNWFAQNWRLDFTREEVGLRRWSGGRVWELYKASTGNELFVAGDEKETGLLDVYVAELDGELKVVR